MFTKEVNIIVEVGQQHQLAEVFQRVVGVAWQPILDDFLFHFFCDHSKILLKDKMPRTKIRSEYP